MRPNLFDPKCTPPVPSPHLLGTTMLKLVMIDEEFRK